MRYLMKGEPDKARRWTAMDRTIPTIAASIWLVVPPLLLSALIHMADPDIDGWAGLASASALVSVAVFGTLACAVCVLCLGVLMKWGWSALVAASGVVSLCAGLVVTVSGSGATTLMGRAWTLTASTGIVLVFVLASVIPAVALNRAKVLSAKHRKSHRMVALGLSVVCVMGTLGCGSPDDAESLPTPERFDWGGGQPVRFSPAPADWRREKTTSNGLLGLRFVKSGSVGEGITMAERYQISDHDRCAEIDEMLARCNDISWRELSELVRNGRVNVWDPLSDHEAYMGDQINSAMDRAVEAARNGDGGTVCRELETAREQASRIVFTLDDVDDDDLVVFRTGGLVPADAYTPGETSRTEVAGEPAIRRDYTFDHRGHHFIGREIFVMHNNRLFVAHFHGLEKNLPLFEGMIESVVFPAGECTH